MEASDGSQAGEGRSLPGQQTTVGFRLRGPGFLKCEGNSTCLNILS